MTEFNRGIDALRRSVGVDSRKLVEKETAELIKTLVRQSPAASSNKIKDDIKRKFEALNIEVSTPSFGKVSKSGMRWVGVNKAYLSGIAPEKDMRNASVSELKKVIYETTKKFRLKKDFVFPRKRQKVLLLQRILASKKTINQLAMAKSKNRGRLKAAWLKSVVGGVIKLTGGNVPPGWVSTHARGGFGSFENGLSTPNNPSFTIANFAKGVKNRALKTAVAAAVSIRAKAMIANAKLFASGKKNLADYK